MAAKPASGSPSRAWTRASTALCGRMSAPSTKREVLVAIMCEEVRAIKNLPKMLDEVPGIGVVIIGEGDLSQDLGFPRQYEHPTVASAIEEIFAVCNPYNCPFGPPH